MQYQTNNAANRKLQNSQTKNVYTFALRCLLRSGNRLSSSSSMAAFDFLQSKRLTLWYQMLALFAIPRETLFRQYTVFE